MRGGRRFLLPVFVSQLNPTELTGSQNPELKSVFCFLHHSVMDEIHFQKRRGRLEEIVTRGVDSSIFSSIFNFFIFSCINFFVTKKKEKCFGDCSSPIMESFAPSFSASDCNPRMIGSISGKVSDEEHLDSLSCEY